MTEVERAIRERRSIRRFGEDPVPERVIRELLDTARWAPSWANTQSWRIFVVRGRALEAIAAELDARNAAAVERRFDLPPQGPDWPPLLQNRTQRLVAARQAVEAVAGQRVFFGAPCLVFFTIDERLRAEYACFDLGLIVQSFCLAAHARGLGTCIMARAVAHPDLLRAKIPAADGQRFVVGVALGVPDREAPVNRFERERASLEELATWLE